MTTSGVVCASLVLAVLPGLLSAQNVPATPIAQTTPTAPEPIERQLRKTVAFLALICSRGDMRVRAQGTGFFVAVSDSRLPNKESFEYLVTNRHVAMCWTTRTTPCKFSR